MRLNQYVVTIPIATIRNALNISDDIESIEQILNTDHKTMAFIVQSKTPLTPIKGSMMPEVLLGDIQKPKRVRKKKENSELE